MKIELPEPRPAGEVATQTLLRAAIGAVVMVESLRGLFDPRSIFSAANFDAGSLTDVPVSLALGFATTAGIFLVAGLLSRTAGACIAACASLGLWVMLETEVHTAVFELTALAIIASAYFAVVGGGPVSIDHLLAERARRKAIERDPIWSRPPYVTGEIR